MDEPVWRTASRGRCFVYLLPCREEDTQKIGLARDPWRRMQAFHPRFHQFFDLDRGALLETDKVVEAQAIELRLKAMFAGERATAPLSTRQRAGGKSEWFRGIDAAATRVLRGISADTAYPLHAPLGPWLKQQWMARIPALRDWIRQQHEWIEMLCFNGGPGLAEQPEQVLRNRIESWDCIGLPLDELLGDRALHWFRHGFDR